MDPRTGHARPEVKAHDHRIRALLSLPGVTGGFVSAGADGWLRGWTVGSDGELTARSPKIRLDSPPARLAPAPGGTDGDRSLLVLSDDGFLRSVGADGAVEALGMAVEPDPTAEGFLTFLAVHPDQPRVVIGRKFSLWCYDYRSRKRWMVDSFENSVSALLYTPDGRELLCAHGSLVDVRDAVTGALRATIQPTKMGVADLALSADGRLLLCADSQNKFTFWSLSDRAQLGPPISMPGTNEIGLTFVADPVSFFYMDCHYTNGQHVYHARRWAVRPEDWAATARQIANRPLSDLEARRFGL